MVETATTNRAHEERVCLYPAPSFPADKAKNFTNFVKPLTTQTNVTRKAGKNLPKKKGRKCLHWQLKLLARRRLTSRYGNALHLSTDSKMATRNWPCPVFKRNWWVFYMIGGLIMMLKHLLTSFYCYWWDFGWINDYLRDSWEKFYSVDMELAYHSSIERNDATIIREMFIDEPFYLPLSLTYLFPPMADSSA